MSHFTIKKALRRYARSGYSENRSHGFARMSRVTLKKVCACRGQGYWWRRA